MRIETRLSTRFEQTVYVDGAELSPTHSQRVFNHSPDGFAWGYGGSGPAQLALAILLLVLPEKEAVSLHQRFKQQFIELLPQDKPWWLEIDVEKWARKELALERA